MSVLSFDEVNKLGGALYERTKDIPKKKRKKKIEDEILELLIMAYIDGYHRVDPDADIPVKEMYDAVYYLIDGETFADRISREIDEGTLDRSALERIAETEYHRVGETGAYNSAQAYEARTGLTAYKQWLTMQDNRVRDTHWYLEGTTVLSNGYFYTFDGDRARFPGGFQKAENNINCRCIISYSFR